MTHAMVCIHTLDDEVDAGNFSFSLIGTDVSLQDIVLKAGKLLLANPDGDLLSPEGKLMKVQC